MLLGFILRRVDFMVLGLFKRTVIFFSSLSLIFHSFGSFPLNGSQDIGSPFEKVEYTGSESNIISSERDLAFEMLKRPVDKVINVIISFFMLCFNV